MIRYRTGTETSTAFYDLNAHAAFNVRKGRVMPVL
jgi:hypothetical protein